jgi:hypothetical protein
MLPGDLYHVDSLVCNGEVRFAEVSRYHRPLLEVYQGGGIYATRTLPRQWPEVAALRRLNEQVLVPFGLVNGASHTEFLRNQEDGQFYFIETSARVGGANIAEMVVGATGVNLWVEWAKIEVDPACYRLPPVRGEYGGVTISLARQEWPDTSSFTDPEIYFRLKQKLHRAHRARLPRHAAARGEGDVVRLETKWFGRARAGRPTPPPPARCRSHSAGTLGWCQPASMSQRK